MNELVFAPATMYCWVGFNLWSGIVSGFHAISQYLSISLIRQQTTYIDMMAILLVQINVASISWVRCRLCVGSFIGHYFLGSGPIHDVVSALL